MWVSTMRSPKARPVQVQRIAPSFTIFIEPATKGGARLTKEEDPPKEYSNDGESWYLLLMISAQLLKN